MSVRPKIQWDHKYMWSGPTKTGTVWQPLTCDPWNTHRATPLRGNHHMVGWWRQQRYGYGPVRNEKWYVIAQITAPFMSFHIRHFNSHPTWAPLMDPCLIHFPLSTPCDPLILWSDYLHYFQLKIYIYMD